MAMLRSILLYKPHLVGVCKSSFNLFEISKSSSGSIIVASSFHSSQLLGSYYSEFSGKSLWKTTSSVSNAGRKRGRAKGLIKPRNLNFGQVMGMGKAKVSWPGLNSRPLDANYKKTSIGKIPEERYKKYEDGVQEIQNSLNKSKKRFKQSPLQRGWSGGSPQGRIFPMPNYNDPTLNLSEFMSILLRYKTTQSMTGLYGIVRRLNLLMVVGNQKGLAGFANKQVSRSRAYSFQLAANKAGLHLCHIPLYENRTVYHDFFTQFGSTRIFVQQRPEGHGLEGHRAIVAACKVIGIKDLYAHVEGADRNYKHMIVAFFLGLMRQKSHQALADEKKMHLVELKEECDSIPRVVASPSDGYIRKSNEILSNEILDFQHIVMEGTAPFTKPDKWTRPPNWENHPSWKFYIKKTYPQRHHKEKKREMIIYDGELKSHLTQYFPECVPFEGKPLPKRYGRFASKKNDENEEEAEE